MCRLCEDKVAYLNTAQICASANYRKVMKAEPSWVVLRKLAVNLELSIGVSV